MSEAQSFRALYRCTNKLGDFYVTASGMSEAAAIVEAYLNIPQAADSTGYGFHKDRRVTEVVVIADEIPEATTHGSNPRGYPLFSSSGPHLIISDRIIPCVKEIL